eukprot:TRINITY_DN4963_c0_g1_i2.p1 TRINITY_DN4963_c0_g1~~TRINITY_DN4963_c0_g1_i2.p1  ORF type:complete len:402 (-),score=95.35 TRINITY_DN4963_c0_g1_i2:310-1515(-)
MEPTCEPTLDRHSYSIIRLVGQGTFGKVFEATDGAKNRVAIKRIEKNANFISREVDILGIISHPNCIELKDVFYTYSEDNGATKKYQNLVFDFVPYTLSSLLKRKRPSLQVTKAIFYQLCLSLSYIHSKSIAHRDITPNNILVTASGELKLSDFGSAKILDDDHVSMSYICSRYYRAPELLMGSSNYTTKIDVWSAGCILAEMLMGKPIFPGVDSQDQFVKIVLILGTPSLADLWAMKKNYKQTFQFPKIEPLWFGEFLPDVSSDQQETVADLLSRMLCYNPKKRASISEILSHPFFDDVRNVDQVKSVSEEAKFTSSDPAAINTVTETYIKSIAVSASTSTNTPHSTTLPSSSITTRPFLTSENSLEKIKVAQQQQQQGTTTTTTRKHPIDSTAAGQAQA